jgi:primosomal protein N'
MGTVPSRLIAEITNRVAKGIAGEPASNRSVIVGTERDLAGIDEFDLAIAVDVDALLFGHNYRASEEALRVIARVVRSVHRGKGYRAILQTSTPQSRLIAALRRADPIAYLEGVLADRAKNGFPPATEMMAIEVRSDPTDDATSLLDTLAGSMIIGSVPTQAGHRWLLQGDLSLIKSELRTVVQKLRDSGVTVRIDVDPIDL